MQYFGTEKVTFSNVAQVGKRQKKGLNPGILFLESLLLTPSLYSLSLAADPWMLLIHDLHEFEFQLL